jgi:transposase
MITKLRYRLNLTSAERDELEQLARAYTMPQQVARRARIILLADGEGMSNASIATELGINKAKVRRWTQRWVERAGEAVLDRLSDLPRCGAPETITPEQWCRVIALACESPDEHGYPMTHWSSKELAAEAIKQGIVKHLSAGHLRKVLQQKSLQPHRSRCWLNAKPDARKDERIADICTLYQQAAQRPDELVLSTDEMTAIQALERIAPDLPMGFGKPVPRELEYQRHGTQTLIAAIKVATGTVCGWVGETRTEEDFARFIEWVIQTNPDYRVDQFVLDQLNTHKPETLVQTVAKVSELQLALGKKGKSGILQSMETREAFLSRADKRVVFHYTPKHASWMNQIEIWLGILARNLIKRGNFRSTGALRDKLLAFIGHFNATMAKPFKWTYQGKPLLA